MPTDNPNLLNTLNNFLVATYEREKDSILNEKIDDIDERILFNRGLLLIYIGKLYYARSNYERALVFSKKSLRLFRQILPEKHVEIARALYIIGSVYRDLNKYDECLNYYNESLEILRQISPGNDLKVKGILINIGFVYFKLDKIFDCLKYLTLAF